MTAPARSVLVTGCSSGIGAACAEAFLRAGFTVHASARRPESLDALARLGCQVHALDVTRPETIDAVVSAIEAANGQVDILVNNAGYGQQGAFETLPLDAFRAQLETNLIGAIATTQRVLPRMRTGGRGRILMISSMGGRLAFPGGAAYHASKYALEATSDVLRFEVSRFGIDVVVVEPGLVASRYGEASLARLAHPEDGPYATFHEGLRDALERSFGGAIAGISTPEEVAAACVEAATATPAPTRVVVGAMAQELIRLRASLGDEGWDALLDTMYPRPAPREP